MGIYDIITSIQCLHSDSDECQMISLDNCDRRNLQTTEPNPDSHRPHLARPDSNIPQQPVALSRPMNIIGLRRSIMALVLVIWLAVMITIDSARTSPINDDGYNINNNEDGATPRPRTMLNPLTNWVRTHGQEINYAPVVVVEGDSKKNQSEQLDNAVTTTPPPPATSFVSSTSAAESESTALDTEPKNTGPFRTTYNAKSENQEVPEVPPKMTAPGKY